MAGLLICEPSVCQAVSHGEGTARIGPGWIEGSGYTVASLELVGGAEDTPTAISGPGDLDNFNFPSQFVKWLIISPRSTLFLSPETFVAPNISIFLLLLICPLVKQSLFLERRSWL